MRNKSATATESGAIMRHALRNLRNPHHALCRPLRFDLLGLRCDLLGFARLVLPLLILGAATFPHTASAESTLGQQAKGGGDGSRLRLANRSEHAPSRAQRDDRLSAAFAMAFGGTAQKTRAGHTLEITFDPKLPRPRAFPKENARLFRALLRATSAVLGGDQGDDYRVESYFGEPPAEPRYLEAKQRITGSEVTFAEPLVQAWFDDAGYLVRVRVLGDAVKGTSEVPRSPRIDEGRATACAVRATQATPSEVSVRLVLALRDGRPYLAYHVRAKAPSGQLAADVDASTCAVRVHEGEH